MVAADGPGGVGLRLLERVCMLVGVDIEVQFREEFARVCAAKHNQPKKINHNWDRDESYVY